MNPRIRSGVIAGAALVVALLCPGGERRAMGAEVTRVASTAAVVVSTDGFESGGPGVEWTSVLGFHAEVGAGGESRLAGIEHPTTATGVMRVALDGSTSGIHLTLGGAEGRDMAVEAWVFCEGNDGAVAGGGYQAIVARASYEGTENFVRLAWDPDHSEPGDAGDGWVKLQAYNGATWDYLGIDYGALGSSTPGYIVNGTTWPSGWHRFRLEVIGTEVRAYVDDLMTPCATGTMSVSLRNGRGGFYVYTSGDYAGYFDDFVSEVDAIVSPTPTPSTHDFDVVIRGGEVYADGETSPRLADVGIVGERIAAVGDLSAKSGAREINADGLMVVPGFIDTHTHADGGGTLAQYLRQGVTTVVTGNCGGSPQVTNVGGYYSSLAGKLGPNYIGLMGHNSLRSAVGLSATTPTLSQMTQMRTLLSNGMEAGAFGLSTGLIYATGFNARTEEIVELAEVVAARDGLYTTHMRSESEGLLDAVDEALRIGGESGCRVVISHVKCAGPYAWGKAFDLMSRVDAANAAGTRVRMDQYPYTASQTTLSVLLPVWALNAWSDAVANHREQLEADIRALVYGRGGAESVFIISGTYAGQWLSEVATSLGKDVEDVLIDNIGPNGGDAVYHWMQEADVVALLPHPMLGVGSDGPTSSHPRGVGTFPRFWGHYVRELGLVGKQEGVRKTSTLAARQFRLLEQGRGRIHPGYFADITVFAYDSIADLATYENPTRSPTGIRHVIVNGKVAVDGGAYTGVLSGKVLRLGDSEGSTAWVLH